MKPLAILLFAVAFSATELTGAVLSGWSTNLPAVLEQAKGESQPVLVYFTASWCGPCKMMARTTFTNEAVNELLGRFPHVALDIDEHPDSAHAHKVEAVPTFMLLTPAGDETRRATGYKNPDQFITWLTNGVSEFAVVVARQKRQQERLATVAQLVQNTDTNSLSQTASELFDLCAEGDAAVLKQTTAALGVLADRQPAVVLEGLNHPRLATRIQVANLLRARLGDDFNIDPWSDAAERQGAVARWRARLAGASKLN